MNGHEHDYIQSNEKAARAIAYLGPYFFWATVGVIAGGIWMLQ
ncbi:MAG: hypothetical protein VB949_12965 [Pseudomonadales bacterium]